MMIYAITIYGEAGVFESLPKERQDEVLAGHGALQDALRARGEFVSIKLMPPTSAVTVDPAPGTDQPPLIVDGPFAETKELVAGYWIWEVDSMDDAVEWAKRCPNPQISDSDIEIRPFLTMDDFAEISTPEIDAKAQWVAEESERQHGAEA